MTEYSGSGPQPFIITETTAFMATPTTQVSAEPGHKFAIELPTAVVDQLQQGLMNSPVSFDFEFVQAPSFTIAPAGSGSNPLAAILGALRRNPNLVCNRKVYDLRAAAGSNIALFLPYVSP